MAAARRDPLSRPSTVAATEARRAPADRGVDDRQPVHGEKERMVARHAGVVVARVGLGVRDPLARVLDDTRAVRWSGTPVAACHASVNGRAAASRTMSRTTPGPYVLTANRRKSNEAAYAARARSSDESKAASSSARGGRRPVRTDDE